MTQDYTRLYKTMKQLIIMMAMAIASFSASAQKAAPCDTLVITTNPQMHCTNCEKKIKSNIRFVKGVKKIITSVPEQKVTIIYESKKSGYEDFAKAFQKIGYDIEKLQK